MTFEEWTRAFARLAMWVPGLGGVASFDALTVEEVGALLDFATKEKEREAAAWRKR